eukprot:g1184.t1
MLLTLPIESDISFASDIVLEVDIVSIPIGELVPISDSIVLRTRSANRLKATMLDRANTAPPAQLGRISSLSTCTLFRQHSLDSSSISNRLKDSWSESLLPEIIPVELEPMDEIEEVQEEKKVVKLDCDDVSETCSQEVSELSCSTIICTDDMDEVEMMPQRDFQLPFTTDTQFQSMNKQTDVIEEWDMISQDEEMRKEEVHLLSRTDGGSTELMGMPSWNQNPSFVFKKLTWNEPSVRTADDHLVELARQALETGNIPKTTTSAKVDPQLRITGVNGLPWECNPAFSDVDSTCEKLPSIDLNIADIGDFENEEKELNLTKSCQLTPTVIAAPQLEEDYEWMEIIKMEDKGVQMDWTEDIENFTSPSKKQVTIKHRLEMQDQDIVMFFDETPVVSTKLSKTVQSSDKLSQRSQDKKHRERATNVSNKDLTGSFSARRNNQREEGEDIEQTPSSFSLSFGSDCLNNLPIPSCLSCDQKTTNQVANCTDCAKKDDRLKSLENEIREMKLRMVEMEIELCNRDSIIAQQDSMIHRLTSNTRSQRFSHRRTHTTIDTITRLDDVTAEEHTDVIDRNDDRKQMTFCDTQPDSKIDPQDLLQKQQAQIKLMMAQLEKCRFL